MLIGSARVSKADGSQSLDLQRDALRAAGVDAGHAFLIFFNSRRQSARKSGSASRAATSCVTWSSGVKCRVGLAVLVGCGVRLRSVGDGILGAFFLLRARWGSTVAPNYRTGGFPFREHTATRQLASAQPAWSRRYAPPSLRCGPSGDPPARYGSEGDYGRPARVRPARF